MICDALLKKYDEVCSLNKMGWFEETKATKNTSIRHSSHHRRTVLQYRFRFFEIQAALRNIIRTFFRSQIVLRLALHRILLLQLRVSLHTGLPVDEPRFLLYRSRQTTLLCMCFVRLFNIKHNRMHAVLSGRDGRIPAGNEKAVLRHTTNIAAPDAGRAAMFCSLSLCPYFAADCLEFPVP